MTVVSSHRPHSGCAEYQKNQIRAYVSWLPLFDKIIYLGDKEPDLVSPKTYFVKSESFPSIHDLARIAAAEKSHYVALVNADIVLTPPFAKVLNEMRTKKKTAGLSRRFTFYPHSLDYSKSTIEDFGMDVFIATPAFWSRVAKSIPKQLRIGHPRWDTWMYGFFLATLKSNLADFTKYRCVFHPHHGGRSLPYEGKTNVNDYYIQFAGLPVLPL